MQRWWLLLGIAMMGRLLGLEEAALPAWNGDERKTLEKAGWVAGGLLLTDDPVPNEPEPVPALELAVEQPTAEEIAEDPTPASKIPERFLPAYFAERPKSFLVDPQRLLSEVEYRDRLNFLNYHAGDSTIDLYVYVMGGAQEIPGEVREEELNERFFSEGRPAAIVYYYLGAPQKTMLYLSPSLTDSVPAAEQRRALASSTMQAFEKIDPNEQLEAFLVQMSIRIYWMERMKDGKETVGTRVGEEGVEVKDPVVAAGGRQKVMGVLAKVKPYGLPVGVIGALVVVLVVGRVVVGRRARYVFPEFEVEPRLGGEHAAGVGAVISFASAALPPASQRDQVPDYLRRA